MRERIAVFVLAFLASLAVMFVGYDAYEYHQRRLVVIAALDPNEITDINLNQLKAIRGVLENRLQGLEPDIKQLAPDLEPGSIEVVIFPQATDQITSIYLILVRYHDQVFGFTVLNNREAAAVNQTVMEIENSVKLFLTLRRQHLTRPGQRVAGAVF